MSNCQRFEIPQLDLVGWHLASAALRPILHTVVFTRSLDATVPRDCYEPELGLSYAAVEDAETLQYIDQKIQEFVLWLQRRPSHTGRLKVAFFDEPVRRATLFAAAENSCWEEWTICVSVSDQEDSLLAAETAERVKTGMEYITHSLMTHSYPLPPIGKFSMLQSFRISIVMGSKAAEMCHTIRKALQDINATSLLR